MTLSQTFDLACEYFNSQNWNALERLLDVNVTMKKIDDPKEHHESRVAVMAYFNGHGTDDKARFIPSTRNEQIVGNIGLISGSGDWFTTSDTRQPVTIAYAYAFRNDNGNWLAINLWGVYAPGSSAA